jgi:hypothetical protein
VLVSMPISLMACRIMPAFFMAWPVYTLPNINNDSWLRQLNSRPSSISFIIRNMWLTSVRRTHSGHVTGCLLNIAPTFSKYFRGYVLETGHNLFFHAPAYLPLKLISFSHSIISVFCSWKTQLNNLRLACNFRFQLFSIWCTIYLIKIL